MFQKALMEATYVQGCPGKLAPAHEKAEHHRFKSLYLFKDKNTPIPRDLYALRLIQQLLIIKKLEIRMQHLPDKERETIGAFFTLSFLKHLWRTPGMEEDLRLLDVDPETISQDKVAKTTKKYLKEMDQLEPKALLAHFLLHVAGFMHGGYVIQKRYIEPSNKLTHKPIPSNQYDFSAAIACLETGKKTPIGVYNAMMVDVNTIPLDAQEYEVILTQCQGIYETMSDTYDDLCKMQTAASRYMADFLAFMVLCLFVSGMALQFTHVFSDSVMAPIITHGG